VGVEQREPRRGVAPEGGDDARAGPGGQRAHLDARVRRHPRHPQQGAVLGRGLDAVRGRLRREEGQPRRHRRRDVAHSTLPPAAPAAWASSHDGGARGAGWLLQLPIPGVSVGERAGGGGTRSRRFQREVVGWLLLPRSCGLVFPRPFEYTCPNRAGPDIQPMARHALARPRRSPARRPPCPFQPGPVRVLCLGRRPGTRWWHGPSPVKALARHGPVKKRVCKTRGHVVAHFSKFQNSAACSAPFSSLSRSRATRLGDLGLALAGGRRRWITPADGRR
jgi:hypothetical protein